MGKVVCDQGMSVDGYVAGPNQSPDEPLGEGGERLHRWMFEEAAENAAEIAAIVDAGAFIMGRNMFAGPGSGAWDRDWKGWWGPEPPYHGPVFVLTHHPHEPIEMDGGTTFHFVTDGIKEALQRARDAAGDRNISIAGGAATVNQFLAAGLIDELRLHVAPMLLGRGERLFAGLGAGELTQVAARQTSLVTHLTYTPA